MSPRLYRAKLQLCRISNCSLYLTVCPTNPVQGDKTWPQTCVVCLSEQREVILMNCGHVCVCAGCAMEIMASRPNCPICRANIVQVAPAYIA